MIKGIIFDMDGVLVNSEPVYFNTFVEIIESDGYKVDIEDFKTIVGKSHKKSVEMISSYYGEEFDSKSFFEKVEKTLIEKQFSYKNILFPYVIPLLEKLKEQGYKLALASSSLKRQIDIAVKQCGIEKYFSVISSGEDFHESKPNPEIYLTTAKKLGLKSEECIAVEDSFSGIKSGKNAGMIVIAKKDNEFNINQEKADFIVEDLKIVPTIVEIINSNNTNYEYKIFEYGSKLYLKSLFLRNEGLRKEYNLNIFKENLENEKENMNIGFFHNDKIIANFGIKKIDENTARIINIVVDKEYRNIGIGKTTLETADKICKSLGFKKVFIKAREKKLEFYKENGFIINSEGYNLEPTNTIHYDMIKNI